MKKTVKEYIPERGDIIWLHFDPQTGVEMSGRHMALVISHTILNRKTRRAIVCPITSKIKKGRPLDVILPDKITSKECAILPDQIKSVDYNQRDSQFVCQCPKTYLVDVINKVFACIGGV